MAETKVEKTKKTPTWMWVGLGAFTLATLYFVTKKPAAHAATHPVRRAPLEPPHVSPGNGEQPATLAQRLQRQYNDLENVWIEQGRPQAGALLDQLQAVGRQLATALGR